MSDKRKLVNVDFFFFNYLFRYILLISQCFFIHTHNSKRYYTLVSHSDTIYLKYLIFSQSDLLKIKISITHEFWPIYPQPQGCLH